MEVRRHLPDESLFPQIKAIEEMAITPVELIKNPTSDFDAIGFGSVDQFQCNFRFGSKFDLVRNVVFFRRSMSSAHSLGR